MPKQPLGEVAPLPLNRSGADEAVIEVRGLTKRFKRGGDEGDVVPVDNVSLDVRADEMVVLLGPSGCGKTTLLRCIAGLERPDAGEIYISKQLVFSAEQRVFVPPDRRPVSMVFQSYALWPHMTLVKNVMYPLRARGTTGKSMSSSAARVLAMEVLETVGLADIADQYPGEISGGQQQRVALARAVVSQSGVVLFDEPLSNVDAKVREYLRLEILEMQRKLGFTGLYVTHDQVEAMAVADRVAVLNSGRIEQIGPPEAVYNQPASGYVGSFFGSANFWIGTILHRGPNSMRVETPLGEVEIAQAWPDDPSAEGLLTDPRVMVLNRPEQLRIHTTQPTDLTNCWPATVTARLFLGSHTEYVLRSRGQQRIRVWSADSHLVQEGDDAWISIPGEALRVHPYDESVVAELKRRGDEL